MHRFQFILFVLFGFCFYFVSPSVGDLSRFYQDSVKTCKKEICDAGLHQSNLQWLIGIKGLPWSCTEDCEYVSQWETVKKFEERYWGIPQFHGKWPFVRFLGLQEPASALFSLLNFYVIRRELRKFQKAVSPKSLYYWHWVAYSWVCLNAWIWSFIFHARDRDFTERMDYICAFSIIFVSFYNMSVRTLELGWSASFIVWSIFCSLIFFNHIAYLWFFKFDYTYNMALNVIVGSFTIVGWLTWAIKNGKNHPGTKSIALFCILIAGATLLEVTDFPPIFWTFDSHSLWHLSTVFINPLFYDFIQKDALYAPFSSLSNKSN